MELTARASSLPMYPDCPRRWAARHLSREIEGGGYRLAFRPLSIGAAIGSATHEVVGFELAEKMRTGEPGNATEAEQRGLSTLEERIADGAIWDEVSPGLNEAQHQVRRQARSYREHVTPTIQPVIVEKRLKAVHGATGIVLSGQQDVVIANPKRLEDLKTGRHRRMNHAQYGSYTRLLRSHGHPVDEIAERYVARVSIRDEQPRPVLIRYDVRTAEAATESILLRVRDDVDRWRASGDPESFIANPASMLCHENWCPAFGTKFCRHHKGAFQ